MKKILTLVLMLFTLGSSGCVFLGRDTGQVIYGFDDRKDYYEMFNRIQRETSGSVLSAWNKDQLIPQLDGSYELYTIDFGYAYNLALTEPFRNQPIGAHCTAFLVAPDIIVTAGHCVSSIDLLQKRWVFGFRMLNNEKCNTRIEPSEVYKGKEIIARQLLNGEEDFAVVRLDRPVVGHTPLKVSRENVKLGEKIYVLGHPCGLPIKLADNGKVISNSNPYYFEATLDTYGGNSGSPVFNKKGEVVGILVRGQKDFISRDGKNYSNMVSENTVRGEGVTRTSQFLKYLPE